MMLKKTNAKASKSMVRGTNCSFGKRFLSGALVVTLLFPNITASRVFGENQQAPSSPQEKSESFYSRTTAKFKELYSKSKNAVKSGADLAVSKGKEAVDWAKNNPVTAGVGSVVGTGVVVGLSVLAKKGFSGNSDHMSLSSPEYAALVEAVNEDNEVKFGVSFYGTTDGITKFDALDAVDEEGRPLVYLAILNKLRNKNSNVFTWFFGENSVLLKVEDPHAKGGFRINLENLKYGEKKETLLHIAARLGDRDVARFLCNYGMNPSVLNIDNQTPLHTAVLHEQSDICYTLIMNGIDDTIADSNERMATAYIKNSNDRALIQFGISLKKRTDDKTTNITKKLNNGARANLCASSLPSLDVNDILMEGIRDKKIDVNTADEKTGETLLMGAVKRGNYRLFVLLMLAGADVNLKLLHSGDSVLQIAIDNTSKKDAYSFDRMQIFDDLLENHQLDINAPNHYGYTPLHSAAANSAPGVITKLVNHGANLEAKTPDGIVPGNLKALGGYTPLHVAAGRQNLEAVRELLNCGADGWAKTSDGQTPSQLATNPTIKSYLKNWEQTHHSQKPAPQSLSDTGGQETNVPSSNRQNISAQQPAATNGNQLKLHTQKRPSYLQRPRSNSASPRLPSYMQNRKKENKSHTGRNAATTEQDSAAPNGQNKKPRPLPQPPTRGNDALRASHHPVKKKSQDRHRLRDKSDESDESTVANPDTSPKSLIEELQQLNATGDTMNSLTHVADGGDNARGRQVPNSMEFADTDTQGDRMLKALSKRIQQRKKYDGYNSDTTNSSITHGDDDEDHGDDDEDWNTNPNYTSKTVDPPKKGNRGASGFNPFQY